MTNFWEMIWLLAVKNWKTTATGIALSIVWLIKLVYPELPSGVAETFTAFLISLGLIFSKDADKSGL